MVQKMHVVGSGPKAGSFAECKAETRCPLGGVHPEQWNLQNAADYIREKTGKYLSVRELTGEQYADYAENAAAKDAVITTELINQVDLVENDLERFNRLRENPDNQLSITYDSMSLLRSNLNHNTKIYLLGNIHVTAPAGIIKLFRKNIESWSIESKSILDARHVKVEITMDKKDYEKLLGNKYQELESCQVAGGTRGFLSRIETVKITGNLTEYGSFFKDLKHFEERNSNVTMNVLEREYFPMSAPDFPVTDNQEIIENYRATIKELRNTCYILNKESRDEIMSKDYHYAKKMINSHLPEASTLFNEMLSKSETPQQKRDIEEKFSEILAVVQHKAQKITEYVLASDRRFDAHLDFMKDISR